MTAYISTENVLNNANANDDIELNGKRLSDQDGYDPAKLLDALINKMRLGSDAALARVLEVMPPVLSKIRHRKLHVGPAILIRMHIVSELSVRELCGLMFGDTMPVSKDSALQAVRQSHR
jgi:hypothetical protein